MRCRSFLEVSGNHSTATGIDANAPAQVYLPAKYDDEGNRVDSDVQSSSYDESFSSCMVGLNVAKEKIPPGLIEADLDMQWKFFADCIKHWSIPQ
jgi:hypothetical protein